MVGTVPQKKVNNPNCKHPNRKHYAKGMCTRCYHNFGRSKLAWACEHKDRPLYSKGQCQTCYLYEYHQQNKPSKQKDTLLGKRKHNGEESPEETSTKRTRSALIATSSAQESSQ